MSAEHQHIGRDVEAVDFFHASADDYAAKHYQGARRTFMSVRLARVLAYVDALAAGGARLALDAGCGPGHLVEALAQRGWTVTGLDGAQNMLETARKRLSLAVPGQHIDLLLGDIEAMPLPDAAFDLVCSTGVVEYLPNDERALAEFWRVLKPGGHLVLPVTNGASPALAVDGVVERLKRVDWLLRAFNRAWSRDGRQPVRPRRFAVRTHRTADFLHSVQAAGFEVVRSSYFHFLPWPRPLDQLLPNLTDRIGTRMESLNGTPFGFLGEGFVVLARKPLLG